MKKFIGTALVALSCAVAAPAAQAQVSQGTAQRVANKAVKDDCDNGALWVCGLWIQPLLSRSGSSWVWGPADLVQQCRVTCSIGSARWCRHSGRIDAGGNLASRRLSC